ncbi:MAG: ATPase P [Faecalibacterium sp.]|jgi:ABC-type multidrug transport system fused ATPase/permease subunit|nr:ATPase P [Faecalibacterium sp.]
MYFKPSRLSDTKLDDATLKADKMACKKYGPCGVGEKALYLNSVFLDRRLYVPISSVKRAYKQIAMSKGGFSGKGVFGSIPYLIVEFDKDKKVKCTFKFEQNVDSMLAEIRAHHPEIKTVSAAAAKRLEKARAEERKRVKPTLSPEEKAAIESLTKARTYLEQRPEYSSRLSAASKAKRVNQRTNPSYKWVSVAIMLGAAVAAAYGIYCIATHTGSLGLYFLLIGLALIFLFASVSVRPTAKSNRSAVEKDLQKARDEMEAFLAEYPGFPLPARYAHPACLTRMIRSIDEGRAQTIDEAFDDLKAGLKALNSDVQVSQEEYDEVVAIKPMFLIEDYQ